MGDKKNAWSSSKFWSNAEIYARCAQVQHQRILHWVLCVQSNHRWIGAQKNETQSRAEESKKLCGVPFNDNADDYSNQLPVGKRLVAVRNLINITSATYDAGCDAAYPTAIAAGAAAVCSSSGYGCSSTAGRWRICWYVGANWQVPQSQETRPDGKHDAQLREFLQRLEEMDCPQTSGFAQQWVHAASRCGIYGLCSWRQ